MPGPKDKSCNLFWTHSISLPKHFLRQKLLDGKCISSSELAKRLLCDIRRNGWRITRGTQPERKILCLESHCYKLCPGPTLSTSLRLDEHKLFCVVPNPYLNFLCITCILFISIQVYSFVPVYPRAISPWLHECLIVSYPVP
jgi:hypothetical protein